jgi:hypothetical protein
MPLGLLQTFLHDWLLAMMGVAISLQSDCAAVHSCVYVPDAALQAGLIT